MAKGNTKKSFLDYFKLSDSSDDDFDDDCLMKMKMTMKMKTIWTIA